jgi:hypothetical protein
MYQKWVYSVMLAVCALVVVPSAAHAQVKNLVLNPSFEEDEVILNDPTWEQWCTWNPDDVTGSNAEIDETESIDGKRSLRIEPVGTENWHFVVAYISVPATTGSKLTASFWVKAQEPRPLAAAFKAADNSVTWGETDFQLTTEWAEYSMTSDSQSDDVKLELWCAASPVTFWLDFVYMYEGEYIAGISPAPPLKASDPDPADGDFLEQTWVNLSWKPGRLAVSHDIYLGDDFDAVTEGTAETFRGNQASTFYVAGFPGYAYPEGLVPGTTYYWRIDEVNQADPNSPWKGDIWSFSIAPKTAYNPNPADGAEFVDLNVKLTWKPGFGAKLHYVYFGDDFDTVSNAAGALPSGIATYTPGQLKSEKVYYWRVDEFDGASTYKGSIWAFTTPGAAGNPQPANGAVDAPMTAKLIWAPATNATSHQVYFGTDKDAVHSATSASPEYKGSKAKGSESYDPGKLTWNSSYYWRVDAVYSTGAVKGLVWTFTTADFISIDDFESYNDLDPPDPASNRIFDAWIDGFATPTTNGALVGNDLPPYTERTIVHGGAQSMPYRYDNTNKTSEATLTLVYPRDWTEEGVGKLSLWFRGDSTNSAERMYVALNSSTVMYHDDPAATQKAGWNRWIIDLQAFQGVTLTNVNTISIGFGTKGSPAAGGTGKMYFDDIRLVR